MPTSSNKPLAPIIILLSASCLFSFLSVFGYAFIKSEPLYEHLKNPKRGRKQSMHTSHNLLGYAPKPNTIGTQIAGGLSTNPLKYSSEGLRIPLDDTRQFKKQPDKILFLGGSYTFGSMCLAEESFPYLVAKEFSAKELNAGVPGYGLVQMMIRAKTLIESHKPALVVSLSII